MKWYVAHYCSVALSHLPRPLQVLYIAEVVNRPEYVPRNPTAENLPNVFDVRFPTVQPYLHRVSLQLELVACVVLIYHILPSMVTV